MPPPVAPSADPWTGRLVGGRWRIVSLLDESGGMANVYLAEDENLPRRAAVKIPKHAAFNEEFRQRFTREAFWHAKVENPHVVAILDRGEEEGTPFLVLQFLSGGNLKSWCAAQPALLSQPALHHDRWLSPIAQALDAVWREGIVHRDVKPSNILFDASGRGYLSDFGIVRAASDKTLTSAGMFIGTLQFMSPEQCRQDKSQPIDGRSDQYGLAVTLYQVLTGWRYPAPDDTAVIYATKLGFAPLIPPTTHEPRIPRAVEAVILRALATHREDRFGTCVEFADAVLDAFGHLAGPRTSATRPAELPGPVEAAVETAARRSWPTAANRPESAPAVGAAPAAAPPRRPRGGVGWLVAAGVGVTVASVAAGLVAGRLFDAGSGGGDAAGVADPADPAARLQAAVTAAWDEFDDGHWPEAAAKARTTLARLDEADPRHQFLRGELLRLLAACNQAEAVDAVAAYDAALAGGIHEADLLRGKGRALRMLDREAEAIACFDQAVALRADDPETLASRGLARMELHDDDAALADLTRAVRLEPAKAERLISLASLHRRLGDVAEAEATLEKAVSVAEAAGDDRRRGEALGSLRRRQEALAAGEAAVARDGRDLAALSGRSRAHAALHDAAAALADAREVARLDPADAGHWLRIGNLEQDELHDQAAALASYNRGLAIAPRHVGLLVARGRLHSKRNDYAAAAADFDAAAAVNPHARNVLTARAAMHTRRREFKEALAVYDRLHSLVPRNPWTLRDRAGVHRSLDDEPRALADCDRALALLPPRDHSGRGSVEREAKRWSESIEAYTRAIAADPGSHKLLHDRAWVYNETHDYEKAAADCRAGLAIDPDDDDLQEELAYALKGLEDHDGAIAAFTELIDRNPRGDPRLYGYRGDARLAKKEYAAARADFEQARDLEPLKPDHWKSLGKTWEAEGDLDQALTCFRRAAEIPPGDSSRVLEPGRMFYRQKDYPRARQEFEEVTRAEPANADAWDWLGAAHREAGDLADAVTCFNESIRLEPDRAHFRRNRAWVLRQQKAYDEAIADYDKAITLEPEDADGYYWRGRCREEMDDLAGAEKDYVTAVRLDPEDSGNKTALQRVRKKLSGKISNT